MTTGAEIVDHIVAVHRWLARTNQQEAASQFRALPVVSPFSEDERTTVDALIETHDRGKELRRELGVEDDGGEDGR